VTSDVHVSPNFSTKMIHLVFLAMQCIVYAVMFPFSSPGGVTYHTAHTATPLLTTRTVYTWLRGHLSNRWAHIGRRDRPHLIWAWY